MPRNSTPMPTRREPSGPAAPRDEQAGEKRSRPCLAKRENKTIDNREKGDNRYGETNGHAGAESLLEKNGVRKLYHFTDRDNLASIIRHGGLYSWADCADKGIDIPKPGSDQMSRSLDARDGLEHYVRVSFVTSHPMMFVAMNDGSHERRPHIEPRHP